MSEHWSAHLDYILVLLGYGVGLGTLWKFPFMCVRNGGGAFLIPFALFTVIFVIPVAFLEMTIGQYSQTGPVNVWNLCPPSRGIGIGTVIMTTIFSTYYTTLMSWFLYYLYHSFSATLPWTYCHNPWNTPTCITHSGNGSSTFTNFLNATGDNTTTSTNMTSEGLTAAEEFWRYYTLQLSGGLTEIGPIRWPIAICLAIMFSFIFLCVFKGIKIAGKVVYVTVTLPYILNITFFIRAMFLEGSTNGLLFYVTPDFSKLTDPKVWMEACSYAFYSVGVSCGCIPTMAGHNRFNNNCTRDAFIFVLADLLSTFVLGFGFFALIGHIAFLRNVPISSFASSGYNLGFIIYPEAVSMLPLPQLWSVLTFLTFLTLGFDTIVPGYEIILMAIFDVFPNLASRRTLITFLILAMSFVVSLIYITQGGMYVLTLVEWYCFFPALLFIAILECVVVIWVYGLERLSEDVQLMWGKRVPKPFQYSLRLVNPVVLVIVLAYSVYKYHPPTFEGFIYPGWATGIGWVISMASITPVVTVFIYHVVTAEGNTMLEKLKNATKPSHQWRRRKSENEEFCVKMIESEELKEPI